MAGLNGQNYAGSMTACLGKRVRRPRYLQTEVMAIPDFWSSDLIIGYAVSFLQQCCIQGSCLPHCGDVWHQHVHGGLADSFIIA
ncbi:hypothetical protein M1D69_10360 [Bacillus sp. PK3-037]